jgi:transcriptional regulator GlxA family with amidase domain
VISRWPDADVHFLAATLDPVRTEDGLTVLPTTLTDPDMIVVPGSETPLPLLEDGPLIDWIRAAAPGCRWTVSLCTGVDVLEDRVVFDGTHVSGAGVAAGIDMALALTERVHGRELAESLQLVIEYEPPPPFDSGSPEKASASTLRLALKLLLGDLPFRSAAALNAQAVRARLGRARRRVA